MEHTNTLHEERQISSGKHPSAAGLMGRLQRYFICFCQQYVSDCLSVLPIRNKFRLERIGLFAIAIFFVFTGSLQAEPIAAKPPLTVVSRGAGAYTKSQMLAFINPYREMKNRWVNVEHYNGGLAQIRTQVRSFNVKWDVVEIEIADAIRACKEGLLEKIDHAVLGRSAVDDFYPEALQDCIVGETIFATVIAYNADQLASEKPSALSDFFNLKRFPGARGLRKSPVVNIEWALMADGVPVDQVYQVLSTDSGVNRAFKVLDRIKKNIVWLEDDPLQFLEVLGNKKVVMTSAFSGGILDAIKKRNENLAIVWDSRAWDMVVWVIPKGGVNLKEAIDFVVFASDPKRMAVHANYISYAPVRKSAVAYMDDSVRKYLPTTNKNVGNIFRIDHKWWITHEKAIEIEARFAQWSAEKPWRYQFDRQD
jgi:putative spermidine/putrescine transport system substrate-binding protein